MMNSFLIDMATVPRSGDRIDYARGTIRLTKKVLSMALAHAKSEGRVRENVAIDAKIPEASERKPRSFTKAEVQAIRRSW